jgi:hypothetical protein
MDAAGVYSFDSKAGVAYALKQDSMVADIVAKYGEPFAAQFNLSRGPGWARLKDMGFGLYDENTRDAWVRAYGILDKMTITLADTKGWKNKEDVYKAAMAEINALKTENSEFKKQFERLNKDTTKPSASEARAYTHKEFTYVPVGRRAGGKGWTRRGKKGGKRGRKGKGLGATRNYGMKTRKLRKKGVKW